MNKPDLERRIEKLEERLSEYHERLEVAVRERDMLALHAAWGILEGSSWIIGTVAAFGLVYWLDWHWAGEAGLFAVTQMAVGYLAFSQFLKGRMADEKKLHRLPEWQRST